MLVVILLLCRPPKKKVRRRRKVPDAVKYHCNYCGVDISHVVRVKCAVCADFDLCVHCFAVGVEVGTHKRNHDYHVMVRFISLCAFCG
jgi:hypothetical protein